MVDLDVINPNGCAETAAITAASAQPPTRDLSCGYGGYGDYAGQVGGLEPSGMGGVREAPSSVATRRSVVRYACNPEPAGALFNRRYVSFEQHCNGTREP